jgi:hypothetical protein
MKTGKIIQTNSWQKKDTVRLHWPSNSVPKTSRTSSNVILRHKFLGRSSLLVAVPTSHASPTIRLHIIWSGVHVQRPLRVNKRVQNRCVSPYRSYRAGSTECTSRYPSLTPGVNSQAINSAQTFLVLSLRNDIAQNRHCSSSPFYYISYYFISRVLPFPSFEWPLYFDSLIECFYFSNFGTNSSKYTDDVAQFTDFL